MTRDELEVKRGQLLNEAEQILNKVKDENRFDTTPEEDKRFDALHAEADRIKGLMDRMAKQESAMEGPGRRTEPTQPNQQTSRSVGKVSEAERAEALRAWALAGVPDQPITDHQRQIAQRCGIDLTSKRLPMAFGGALIDTSPEGIREYQRASPEQRAALTGAQSTTTTGGYAVSDEMMRSLEVALLAFGGVRSVATVLRTATGGPLPIPTTNDTANKGEIIAENITSNELEMTFGQLVLDAYKYSSKYVLASVEFLQDASINVPAFLGSALANRIGRITNDHFTTGTGSGQPKGVVVGAASGVTSVADPPTYDNFVDLVHSIDPEYRGNGRFMMADATLKTIKKIKVLQYSGDTTGVPLWQPSLVGGQQDTILGYPFVINQSMASPGSSAKKILFGDFSKYIVRDVKDFYLLRLDERFAELGQVAFLAFSRHDGDILDAGTNPIKYMQQS
jgi:HK97 family phage major capsid protein